MANPSFFGLSPQETALALEQERMQQLPQNKPYYAGDINFAVANQNLRELGPRVRAAVQERSLKPLIEGGLGGFRDPRMQRALLLDEARQEVAGSGVSLDANPLEYYNSAFTSLMKRGLVDEANQVRAQALTELQALKPPTPSKPSFDYYRLPDGSVIEGERGSPEVKAALKAGAVPLSSEDKTEAGKKYSFYKAGNDLYRVNNETGNPELIASGKDAEDESEIRVIEGTAYRIDPKTGTGTPIKIDGKQMGSEKAERAAKLAAYAENKAKQVLGNVSEAMNLVNPQTTGWSGALKELPGTKARALANKISTIKANLGFDGLQTMRDMSPTGGALGQVAVKELEFLQAAVANLDQLTTAEDLQEQLKKVETHYNNWLSISSSPAAKAEPEVDLLRQADEIISGGK
jgi:hypothetical protein